MGSLIPLLLVVLVFVLLIIVPYRRQAARQREIRSMQAALKPGTEIMTTSGLYGTVVSIAEKTVELEIASGTVIRIARGAIGEAVAPATSDEATYAAGDEEDQAYDDDTYDTDDAYDDDTYDTDGTYEAHDDTDEDGTAQHKADGA